MPDDANRQPASLPGIGPQPYQPGSAAQPPTPPAYAPPEPGSTPQTANPAPTMPPAAPQPIPQAIPPAPGTPVFQPNAQPAAGGPVPAFTPGLGPQAAMPASIIRGSRNRRPLLFGLAGAVVLILVVGSLAAYRLYGSRVTPGDTKTAQQAAEKLANDVNVVSDTTARLGSESAANQVSADVRTVSARLTDAQNQYKTLKASKVQHDTSVHTAFTAFSTKWTAYESYMQDNVTDTQTLLPPLISFESQVNSLSNQAPPATAAALNTYLTSFKGVIDGTSQKLSGAHMANPEDGQILSAFQTLLKTSSKDVAQAQSDLNGSQSSLTVENDLLNVGAAENTFESTETSVDSKIGDHMQQLDPSKQFTGLQNALNALYSKATS